MRRENLHDHYFLKAKKENFSARSVYKLKDILEKYKILKSGLRVLDLGAAPGSWSEYLAESLVAASPSAQAPSLTAIDIQPLSPAALERIRRSGISFQFLQESAINVALGSHFDLVVSDMAPSTQGSRLVDCAGSGELIDAAWKLARAHLKSKGAFIVKVFQSEDNFALVKSWHPYFELAKLYRPPAVRKESKEIYFIGLGFRPLHES